jgi:hypothetical protein
MNPASDLIVYGLWSFGSGYLLAWWIGSIHRARLLREMRDECKRLLSEAEAGHIAAVVRFKTEAQRQVAELTAIVDRALRDVAESQEVETAVRTAVEDPERSVL